MLSCKKKIIRYHFRAIRVEHFLNPKSGEEDKLDCLPTRASLLARVMWRSFPQTYAHSRLIYIWYPDFV